MVRFQFQNSISKLVMLSYRVNDWKTGLITSEKLFKPQKQDA